MNTPAPVVPVTQAATPQATPSAWGMFQSLITGFLTFKGATKLGLDPTYAAGLAGGVASGITSGLHTLAQKWHLTDAVK